MDAALPPVCRNCATPTTGPFCAACGQDHEAAARLTARVTFYDIVDGIVQVNAELVQAAVDLVLFPGRLTADFLAGRRVRHPPPAKLYLVVNFVFFVAVQWFDPVPAETVASLVGAAAYSEAAAQSGLSRPLFDASVENRYADLLPSALVVLVPLLALVLRGLYVRRPLGVVAHTVLGFHLAAFLLVALLPGTVAPLPLSDALLNTALLGAIPLWCGVALHRTYGGAVGWTVLRTLMLWLALLLLLMLYAVLLAGWTVATAG